MNGMILTAIGRDKINTTVGTATPSVEWSHIAFGNGSGAEPTFTESATELVNEVWRGTVLNVYRDETNPAWVYFQTVVPPEDGGFYIREIGIFDADGDLVAVGSFPTSYKPIFTGTGITKTIHTKTAVQIENSEGVTFVIDPSVVMASQAWVSANFKRVPDEIIKIDTSIGGVDVNYVLPGNRSNGYAVEIEYTDMARTAWIKVNSAGVETITDVEKGVDTADIGKPSIVSFIFNSVNKNWNWRV